METVIENIELSLLTAKGFRRENLLNLKKSLLVREEAKKFFKEILDLFEVSNDHMCDHGRCHYLKQEILDQNQNFCVSVVIDGEEKILTFTGKYGPDRSGRLEKKQNWHEPINKVPFKGVFKEGGRGYSGGHVSQSNFETSLPSMEENAICLDWTWSGQTGGLIPKLLIVKQ